MLAVSRSLQLVSWPRSASFVDVQSQSLSGMVDVPLPTPLRARAKTPEPDANSTTSQCTADAGTQTLCLASVSPHSMHAIVSAHDQPVPHVSMAPFPAPQRTYPRRTDSPREL
ncbi:unnamed protein product [Cutaneotrichosporon oleaginosum]